LTIYSYESIIKLTRQSNFFCMFYANILHKFKGHETLPLYNVVGNTYLITQNYSFQLVMQ
jgi:hypothetical protein